MAYRVIGGSHARADAWEKVRGRPIYAGDLALAGMLHGRIVRSPYASARIARLETEAARALPGVIAVLTARDVPRNELRMELPGRMAEATAGAVLATQPVLADGRVRYQGEPGAATPAEAPARAARRGRSRRGGVRRDPRGLRSARGARRGRAGGARGRQRPPPLAPASGRRRRRVPTRRRRRRAHLSHAVRRSRLPGDRDRHR